MVITKPTTSEHRKIPVDDYKLLEASDIYNFLTNTIGKEIAVSSPENVMKLADHLGSLGTSAYADITNPSRVLKDSLHSLLKKVLEEYNFDTSPLDNKVLHNAKEYPATEFKQFQSSMYQLYSKVINTKSDSVYELFKEELKNIWQEKLTTSYIDAIVTYAELDAEQRKFMLQNDLSAKMLFKNGEGLENEAVVTDTKKSFSFDENKIIENLNSWKQEDLETRIKSVNKAFKEITQNGAFETPEKIIEMNIANLNLIKNDAKLRAVYNPYVMSSQLTCALILNYIRGPLAFKIKTNDELRVSKGLESLKEIESLKELARVLVVAYDSNKDPKNTNSDISLSHLPDSNSYTLKKISHYLQHGLIDLKSETISAMDDIFTNSQNFREIFAKSNNLLQLRTDILAMPNYEQNRAILEPAIKKLLFRGIIIEGSALTYLNSPMVAEKAAGTYYGAAHKFLLDKIQREKISPYKELQKECILLTEL